MTDEQEDEKPAPQRCLCGCGAIAPSHRVDSWRDERDPDMSYREKAR
jgi:hypothetical protein